MLLSPFLLFPAFRHGKATPWGGDRLREQFGKPCPPTTGESLEMSVIPGLESTNAQGETLSALIKAYGADLVGTACAAPFPLLLKLIDAQDRLSVQVHPDDAYARAHENKLGKTEAWVILSAAPGAQLVYGIREGTTPDMLKAACDQGKAIENLLRYVPVQAGDVFYIPSGMVHAIGAGIMLYEIQQSSDVTYRFYDWDRTDAQGNRRELHIRQGLDVTRLDLQPSAVVPTVLPGENCRRELLLDMPYFRLERLSQCHETPFSAQTTHFSVITVLEGGKMTCGEAETTLAKGQTIFVPASCKAFTLSCSQCLIASPAHKA